MVLAGGAQAQPAAPPAPPLQGAFSDVPPDHWSREAVQKLADSGVMSGFADGTFKGRKVVTRYDMAMIVARLLAKVTEVRNQGGKLTNDDIVLVNRLTNEFRSELDLLQVKVEAAEKRVDKVERQTSALEAALSNVRIEGFYRLENTFVFTPFNYTNYPFAVSVNPFTNFTDPGLQPLSQEAFLRFIGSPYIGGNLFKNVETFVELRPRIVGPTSGNARLAFKFSGPPIAGDNLDDFPTEIVDDQRVQVDKAHFVSRAKLATVRAFSNESMTDSKDPAILLTVDSFDPAPFSGIEADGVIGKFNYAASALKFISLSPSPFPNGNNPLDLNEFFTPLNKKQNDIFYFRLSYEPTRKAEKGPTNLVFGTTFVEKIFSYDAKNNFNRVVAADMTLNREWTDSKFDLVLEPQFSFGQDPELLSPTFPNQDANGAAFRLDSSYQHQKFLATFRGHSFSRHFRASTGARQYLDHTLPPYRDNFRRKNNPSDPFDPAETLLRLNLKWDLGDKVFTHVKSFTVATLAEGKRFANNPDVPRFDDDHWASRYFVQAIMDWTDKTHVELLHEEQYHLPQNIAPPAQPAVKAIETNKLTVDFKATDKTSVIGEIELISDDNRDAIGPDGKGFSLERTKIQANSQITKTFFGSVFAEQVTNALQRRFVDPNGNVIRPLARNAQRVIRPQRNGLDLSTIGMETNWQIFQNKAAIKTFLLREEAADKFEPTLDGTTDVFVSELSAVWTRALKGRYQWGINAQDLKNRKDVFFVNNFAEVIYTPSEKTELRLTYGYEYENADDRFDDGPYLFFKAEKILQLTAHTDF